MNYRKSPKLRVGRLRPLTRTLKGSEIRHWFGYGGRDLPAHLKAPRPKWNGNRI